jgi:hypothetical protein
MKKLPIPLLVILIGISACAQSSHLDKFYESHQQTSFDPGLLFSASFTGNNDGSWKHKITYLRCLIMDARTATSQEWNELTASLRADHFEDWFSIRKGKGRIEVLSRDGEQEDIACLIVGDDGGGLFFHLRGHFTAEDKARIESALQSHDTE